jgi:CO/xanthine dehydrogenase Mo-binding subunit
LQKVPPRLLFQNSYVFDPPLGMEQNMGELFVGKSYPRMDRDKVTGRAVYITDIRLPRMLYGKILYSTRPHARIKSIDTSKAERLHGVRVV